jgi:hypothetical protein
VIGWVRLANVEGLAELIEVAGLIALDGSAPGLT